MQGHTMDSLNKHFPGKKEKKKPPPLDAETLESGNKSRSY